MESPRFGAPFTLLLEHRIDYAGLFPPASLSLGQVVQNYADYRRAPDRWALGRLIIPAVRLDEFAALLAAGDRDPAGWRLSATLGADVPADGRLVTRANDRLAGQGATVDAVEARVADPAAVAALAGSVAPGVAWYGEVGLATRYDSVLDAIGDAGGFAKIRMGGTTADLIPAPDAVVAFLQAVTVRKLPFKATAGLHHPLRGAYPLTYLADSDSAAMYGYLNLLLATMLTQRGADGVEVLAALLESDPHSLHVDAGVVRWRDHRFGEFERYRESFHGFGSCSFREPIDELGIALTP